MKKIFPSNESCFYLMLADPLIKQVNLFKLALFKKCLLLLFKLFSLALTMRLHERRSFYHIW